MDDEIQSLDGSISWLEKKVVELEEMVEKVEDVATRLEKVSFLRAGEVVPHLRHSPMEEDYRRHPTLSYVTMLEESYRRLEEQCRFYEGRCKALKEENDALREKCDAYERKQRESSEKHRMAVNVRWKRERETASVAVSPSNPCLLTLFARKRNLSDSERNVPVDASKSILQRLDNLQSVVAWQQEEERRAKFRADLYPTATASFQKPTEEQVYEYMHTYTMGAWYIDARDEARQFMDFYEANGWMTKYGPMRDWMAAARNWINMRTNKIKNGNNRKQQADYENDSEYIKAIRSIEEDARYKREHGEPELHY